MRVLGEASGVCRAGLLMDDKLRLRGADQSTLFVTSARFTMTADHLAAHPLEGGLFALSPGVRGAPPNRFGR